MGEENLAEVYMVGLKPLNAGKTVPLVIYTQGARPRFLCGKLG